MYCGRTESRPNKRGCPNWFKVNGGYQCSRCYDSEYRKRLGFRERTKRYNDKYYSQQRVMEIRKKPAYKRKRSRYNQEYRLRSAVRERALKVRHDAQLLREIEEEQKFLRRFAGAVKVQPKKSFWMRLMTPSRCQNCYDKNLLIECKCGCGKVRTLRSKYGYRREFIHGHRTLRGLTRHQIKRMAEGRTGIKRGPHTPEHRQKLSISIKRALRERNRSGLSQV